MNENDELIQLLAKLPAFNERRRMARFDAWEQYALGLAQKAAMDRKPVTHRMLETLRDMVRKERR